MKRARRQHPEPLRQGLAELLGSERLAELAAIGQLRRRWAEVVGPVLARRSEPIAVERGTLLVAVNHPTMGNEVRLLQREIRDACFRRLRIGGIHSLRTIVRHSAGERQATDPERAKPRRVTLSEKKAIARTLRDVARRDLRRALFDAHVAQLRYRRGRN